MNKPEEITIETYYADEHIRVKAPDQDGCVYINIKDSEGDEVSTYLKPEQVQQLVAHITQPSTLKE